MTILFLLLSITGVLFSEESVERDMEFIINQVRFSCSTFSGVVESTKNSAAIKFGEAMAQVAILDGVGTYDAKEFDMMRQLKDADDLNRHDNSVISDSGVFTEMLKQKVIQNGEVVLVRYVARIGNAKTMLCRLTKEFGEITGEEEKAFFNLLSSAALSE